MDRLQLTLRAKAAELRTLREWLRGWLMSMAVSEDDRIELELSAVEAMTNSIEHGYAGRPGTVGIEVTLDDDAHLTLIITDTGGWRVPPDDPGFRGRGLTMMRECTDHLRIDGTTAGTTVWMTRRLRLARASVLQDVGATRRKCPMNGGSGLRHHTDAQSEFPVL